MGEVYKNKDARKSIKNGHINELHAILQNIVEINTPEEVLKTVLELKPLS